MVDTRYEAWVCWSGWFLRFVYSQQRDSPAGANALAVTLLMETHAAQWVCFGVLPGRFCLRA
jgi:hypothetical protein